MEEIEALYERYFRDVYLYALSLCGESHTAQDVASETFLKALESLEGFQGRCDIRVWLCQIAKNTYFSQLRKRRREIPAELLPEKQEKTEPEALAERTDDSAALHQILHLLPEPYKEVFSLRVFGELSFRRIGALFGKTENWACVTYHRARDKIRKEMEERR